MACNIDSCNYSRNFATVALSTSPFSNSIMTFVEHAPKPSESLERIIRWARLISAVVGADVASVNYRMNIITYLLIIGISFYFFFTGTTVASVFSENWTYLLEASCMVGSVLQGITKLATGIVYTKKLSGLRLEVQQLYATYEREGALYCALLQENCERLWRIIKVVGLIYALGTFGVIVITVALVLLTGDRYLIMHFLIPGIDIETDFGYLVTMGAHTVLILAGGFGLFAGDLFFLILLAQAVVFLGILKLKVTRLNTESDVNGDRMEMWLDDIIEWHQYYTYYNEQCNIVFYYIITMQITTSGISILCTLYIVLMGDWPGVYLYVLLALCGLYLYCVIGTRIEVCNDEFCEEIYNIKWYNLRSEQRKKLIFILMKSQNPSNIKVGGVLPLSVTTALSITKTLYGIFTMMLQMVSEEET